MENTALNLPRPEKRIIKVALSDGRAVELPRGIKAREAVAYDTAARRSPVVAVKINNALKSLSSTLEDDCTLDFVDVGTEDGSRVYARSLILVLARAAREILPGSYVTVEHSLGNGLYGEIQLHRPLKESDIAAIERRMQEIVAADEPIVSRKVKKEEAVQLFTETGQLDKIRLLKYRQSATVHLHTCGWFHDYSYGPMAPGTGYLKAFRLRFYLPGFILELPRRDNPNVIPEYVEQGKLANVYFEAEKWGKILGVNDVVGLNDLVAEGKTGDLIRVAEAFHEKKIAQIADLITNNIDRIRIVLIAGPHPGP
ncbi:MAG: nucleoside kinase, partial [Firmicutes bacterium]|nr:nucleoside kinase [Bacillota bacterium]